MAEVIVMPVDTVTGDHKADVNVNETTSPPPPPPSRRYDRDYRRTDNRDIDRIPTCRSDYYEHRNRLPHKQRGGHSPPPFKRYRRDDGRRGSPPDRSAMNLYGTQSGGSRVKLNWVNGRCPCQQGSTECGYFMLKFMKEILDEGIEILVNDNVGGWNNEYTDTDIDGIREEWSNLVASFIYQ